METIEEPMFVIYFESKITAKGEGVKWLCPKCVKSRNLLVNYGITYEEYLVLFEKQDGLCAICKKNAEVYRGAMETIEEPMFVIYFESKITHKRGHGAPMKKSVALAWMDFLDKDYPEIRHWLEPAPDPPSTPSAPP